MQQHLSTTDHGGTALGSPGRALVHRRALLAGLVSGPALVWGAQSADATTIAGTTVPNGSDLGPSTPTGNPTSAPVPRSPNGWSVGSPATSIGVASLPVLGTQVLLPVSNTLAGTVLMYVARRFHASVQPLGTGCWGYAYRANVNNTSVWSNHASGTAIDLNAPLHPNGASGTFTADQQEAIRAILLDLQGTVRWGGDYHSTKDEMHFEINVAPGDETLLAVSTAISTGALDDTDALDDDQENPMRNLILGKAANKPTIWVGDGMIRRAVADLTELSNLQYWIRLKGGDPTVYAIDDLRLLGHPM